MNEKFEEYIKDLSPELQQKARQCKTKDELLQLAAENGLEIPEDALEAVAGGCFTSKTETWVCNACNSSMREEESGYPRVNAPSDGKMHEGMYYTMFKFCPVCKKNYEYCNEYMHKEMR